jgi:hypothetical protein
MTRQWQASRHARGSSVFWLTFSVNTTFIDRMQSGPTRTLIDWLAAFWYSWHKAYV